MTQPVRAVVYARCSDVKQAEKELSIPAQIEACRAEAESRGWVVVHEFVDEGISGRTDARPGFREMIDRAKETPRPFDVIVLWKLSRFARNREHAILYKKLLRKRGVAIHSLHEKLDDSAQGRFVEGIFELIDEFYSENLAQDTKRGMARKARQGFWVGGAIPYGYRLHRDPGRPNETRLVPDDAEAAVVRRLFDEAGRGQGAATLTRALNREGVRTRKGHLWTSSIVAYLLRNRAYLGELRWGTAEDGSGQPLVCVPGAHGPLTDPETVARVDQMIAARAPALVNPRSTGGDYLLSGLLRCGHCGYAFIGHSAKSGQVHYYGCQTKMKSGADQCPAVLLNRDALEAAVVEHLKAHVLTVTNVRALLDEVNAGLGGAAEELVEARNAKRGLLDQQRQQLTRLVDALALGTIDPSVIAERINALKATTDRLQADIADLEARIAEAKPVELTEEDVRAYVDGLRTLLTERPLDEQRAFLRAWVKEITATGKDITVHYTLPGWPGTDGGLPVAGGHGTGRPPSRRRGDQAARGVNQIRRVLALGRSGAPGRARTCDRRLRRPLLYPTELRERHRQPSPHSPLPPIARGQRVPARTSTSLTHVYKSLTTATPPLPAGPPVAENQAFVAQCPTGSPSHTRVREDSCLLAPAGGPTRFSPWGEAS